MINILRKHSIVVLHLVLYFPATLDSDIDNTVKEVPDENKEMTSNPNKKKGVKSVGGVGGGNR
ncbi:hypothetical protein CAEBREN_21587 [Caenorhabditis brenneri]|uniref:Uncharacterized protein n=1 Tax=Caenorhabditis brenneri TaxID=135651 RepID=G0NJ97_CAEBE|nr:hypothetical protein CAEBREN_21587 [Caenorhabditis brenneri]